MLHPGITRRLVVVPLGNDDHGKTGIIAALVHQAERRSVRVQRGPRVLTSPWGRTIDALVIPRSYQETLHGEFGSVEDALRRVDESWRERDLIIFPSHLQENDCATIVELAHTAGFDAIVVSVFLDPSEVERHAACLRLPWDERWTLANDRLAEPSAQVDALGHDLWSWIAAAIERR